MIDLIIVLIVFLWIITTISICSLKINRSPGVFTYSLVTQYRKQNERNSRINVRLSVKQKQARKALFAAGCPPTQVGTWWFSGGRLGSAAVATGASDRWPPRCRANVHGPHSSWFTTCSGMWLEWVSGETQTVQMPSAGYCKGARLKSEEFSSKSVVSD